MCGWNNIVLRCVGPGERGRGPDCRSFISRTLSSANSLSENCQGRCLKPLNTLAHIEQLYCQPNSNSSFRRLLMARRSKTAATRRSRLDLKLRVLSIHVRKYKYKYSKRNAPNRFFPSFDARSTDMAPRVGIIGAGAAGLITAKTLLEDGFHVQVLTRDGSVGGVWAKHRVYPGLYLNK